MNMNEPRYMIHCPACGDDVPLIELMSGDFQCPYCATVYDNEAGVIDNQWISQFGASYPGAVRAGLIKENDVPREEYR